MSLMNDALRKKSREQPTHPAVVTLSGAPNHLYSSRRWVVVLGMLLTLVAALVGFQWIQAGSVQSLSVQHIGSLAPQLELDPPAHRGPTSEEPAVAIDRPEPAQRPAAITDVDSDRHGAAAAVAPTADSTRLPAQFEAATAAARPSAAAMAVAESPPAGHSTPPIDTAALVHGWEPIAQTPVRTETMPNQPPPLPSGLKPSRSSPNETAQSTTAETKSAATPFFLKALTYHRDGRLSEAVRLYQQTLRSDPHHQEAALNLSAAYIAQGDHQLAQPILRRLETTTPRPDGVLLNLAITAIGTGAPEKALDYLDQAAATSDAPPWEIHFHRATALARLNRLTEALTLYLEVQIERPDHPDLQFNLAVTCDALGRYSEALGHYRSFLQLLPAATAAEAAQINQRIRTLERYLGAGRTALKGP